MVAYVANYMDPFKTLLRFLHKPMNFYSLVVLTYFRPSKI